MNKELTEEELGRLIVKTHDDIGEIFLKRAYELTIKEMNECKTEKELKKVKNDFFKFLNSLNKDIHEFDEGLKAKI
jgi:hypothetical protein